MQVSVAGPKELLKKTMRLKSRHFTRGIQAGDDISGSIEIKFVYWKLADKKRRNENVDDIIIWRFQQQK